MPGSRRVSFLDTLHCLHTVVEDQVRATFEKMGEIGAELAEKLARIVEDKDAETARTPEAQNDPVDRLHRAVFTALVSQDNPHTIKTTIDVTLLSRHYERFADHAVPVAHRLVFPATGGLDE